MNDPVLIAEETFALPFAFPIPGVGVLGVTPLVIRGAQPVLVDTGPPVNRDAYLESVFSLVDPGAVRWIFLSHDDRDHSGNLIQLLDRCPNARLLTTFVGVGRMGEEWALPLNRVTLLNDGESFDAGDRTLTAIRPPFFDCPGTRGLWDPKTRLYYSVDSFGAPTPELSGDVTDTPEDVYTMGFNWFNRVNHPWHELTDPTKMNAAIDRVRRLDPALIVSYHGPVARNRSAELCDMLARIPEMEPLALPTQAELEAMLTGAPAH
ncbi:MAG: MBL fold metallo-hydrolase [Candidatus Dormibacteria bacterium]